MEFGESLGGCDGRWGIGRIDYRHCMNEPIFGRNWFRGLGLLDGFGRLSGFLRAGLASICLIDDMRVTPT